MYQCVGELEKKGLQSVLSPLGAVLDHEVNKSVFIYINIIKA